MLTELTSCFAQQAIENLLHVHALANMTRASGNVEHLRAARNWLPQIEGLLRDMHDDIKQHCGSVADARTS